MAGAADGEAGQGAGPPAHEQVYRRLREMILFGDLAPGEAVTIQGLTRRLDAGMTPVREAIRRLTAEGALEFRGNRRVMVPVPDAAALDELEFARLSIERELARRAAQRVSPADIATLAAIDAALDTAIAHGDIHGYLRHNFRFHEALYATAGAPVLTSVAMALWLRIGPSLRMVCGRVGTASLPDRHGEALDALRRRDAEAVAAAIAADISQGMEQVRLARAD